MASGGWRFVGALRRGGVWGGLRQRGMRGRGEAIACFTLGGGENARAGVAGEGRGAGLGREGARGAAGEREGVQGAALAAALLLQRRGRGGGAGGRAGRIGGAHGGTADAQAEERPGGGTDARQGWRGRTRRGRRGAAWRRRSPPRRRGTPRRAARASSAGARRAPRCPSRRRRSRGTSRRNSRRGRRGAWRCAGAGWSRPRRGGRSRRRRGAARAWRSRPPPDGGRCGGRGGGHSGVARGGNVFGCQGARTRCGRVPRLVDEMCAEQSAGGVEWAWNGFGGAEEKTTASFLSSCAVHDPYTPSRPNTMR